MPMFPNKDKQTAKGIDQLMVAVILECGYDAMCGLDAEANGRYVVQWDKSDYLSYLQNRLERMEEESEEEHYELGAEYELWRDNHYNGVNDYSDWNNPASHYHY
jgi:hypothetical protein